jgi:hypothetical protein
MAAPENMGRAYCKVVFYDSLPNVIRDPDKMRKSAEMVLGFESQTLIKRESFGVQFIGVPPRTEGPPLAGAIIPRILYEPVNNETFNSSACANAPVQWNQMNHRFAGGIPPIFKSLILGKTDADVTDASKLPGYNRQTWRSKQVPVANTEYVESEYINTNIDYPAGLVPEIVLVQPDDRPINTKCFASQEYGGKEVWWGIKSNNFKAKGAPFWLTIKATRTYVEQQTNYPKRSYIAVKFAESRETVQLSDGSTVTRRNPHILVINDKGGVMVRYKYKGNLIEVSVNLPHLSEAFENKDETIRVGFLLVAGRLVVFADEHRYDVINVHGLDRDQIRIGFHLNMRDVEVYGWNCRALINVSPMTFFKRAWFIVKNMSGKVYYEGNKSPPSNKGGFAAGTWAPGYYINWQITKEQFEGNNSKPMYAAQFNEYHEVDLIDPRANPIRPPVGTNLPGRAFTKVNDAKYWWGKVEIVRSKKKDAIVADDFWFGYLETEDIVDSVAPGGAITTKDAGFPIVYNLFVKQDSVEEVRTGPIMPAAGRVDVSDDVMNVHITQELDNVKPTAIIKKAKITLFDETNDYSRYLTRARGVKIWLEWSTKDSNPILLTDDPIFVGVAYGESSTIEPGKSTISLTCTDYWGLLDKVRVKNSPFYDGFEVASVVEDLADRAGIKTIDDITHTTGNARSVPFYFLGSGFSFDKPMHRYEGTMTIKECIFSALKMFPYYAYFNDVGELTIAIIPGDFDFSKRQADWDPLVKKFYYREFGPGVPVGNPEKLILNSVNMQSTLSTSIYNSFLVKGVERTHNRVILVSKGNPHSLTNPNYTGYLGHISEIVIQVPALDSQAAVQSYVQRIAKMYAKPGFETSIQTVGHVTPYRPGQFIKIKETVASNMLKFRVTEIQHKFTAEKNEWLTDINAYQITPGAIALINTP